MPPEVAMQRVRIVSGVQVGRQWLSAGVEVLLPSEDARALIASGHAQALDEHAAATAIPVPDGALDVPPAKQRRKATG